MNRNIIRSWMSSPVISISPETELSEARKIMNVERIRSLPVLRDGALVGIVTRRGLLRADWSSLTPGAWNRGSSPRIPVEKIMTREVITTSPQTVVPKAARAMAENKITALPVVDGEKGLVGIITSSDMLRVVIDEIPALKETICVRDCMTTTVITITPETSILEAHRLMAVERIRSLPVVEGEQLAGLVTRTDLLSADHPVWLDDTRDKELALRVEVEDVRRIMSTKLITITPQEGVVQAAGLMLRNKIHCLPVLNDQGGLVGILTETDLFRLITRKFF